MLSFRLYNKDAVIEYLLDKSAERPNAEAVAHIRGIRVCRSSICPHYDVCICLWHYLIYHDYLFLCRT